MKSRNNYIDIISAFFFVINIVYYVLGVDFCGYIQKCIRKGYGYCRSAF
ncbi:hypothetical protein SAMN02746089_02320 [Caldanaerobius fijiensis DSM 17918]|uniref:Uncharacterized protein n=1 Tax=Caldanaerobius fijiensis DSM 17918 TaxID=1121256 RepID=A0A1M5DE58_9THEO|nr:hypothetical protein SAMN02746089_02320 [Caldanaerobius fijiensis DSM 17918]